MNQLTDEQILKLIDQNEKFVPDQSKTNKFGDMLSQLRAGCDHASPDFVSSLEKKLAAAQLARNKSQSKTNPILIIWRNKMMRRFTLAATPALALLLIGLLIFDPFSRSFDSHDFLQKAYASYESQATGAIHYIKTHELPGKDQPAYEQLMQAQFQSISSSGADTLSTSAITTSANGNFGSGAFENETWSNQQGDFMYVMRDLNTGEIIDAHLTRINSEGDRQAYFKNSDKFELMNINDIASVGTTLTAPASGGSLTIAGSANTSGEVGMIAPEMGLTVMSGGVSSDSSGMVSIEMEGSTPAVDSEPSNNKITVCSGEPDTSNLDETGQKWIDATENFYQQLDALHSEKNKETIKAILGNLKQNDQVNYEGTADENGTTYQIFSFYYPTPDLSAIGALGPAILEQYGTRLFFDAASYHLTKEQRIVKYEDQIYELGTTVFVEDKYINDDREQIFDPARFDLTQANLDINSNQIVMLDSTNMPEEPGCYTMDENEEWQKTDDSSLVFIPTP